MNDPIIEMKITPATTLGQIENYFSAYRLRLVTLRCDPDEPRHARVHAAILDLQTRITISSYGATLADALARVLACWHEGLRR